MHKTGGAGGDSNHKDYDLEESQFEVTDRFNLLKPPGYVMH